MHNSKVDKKFTSKIGVISPSANHSKVTRSSSANGFNGTTLAIEIIEVQEGTNNKPIVGGPYLCVLEVVDPSNNQIVWKQKSSSQFTAKPPIIFGDAFKVKNFAGDWGLDIKPGYVLKVQLCMMMEDKVMVQMDSARVELKDLVVNKEQIESIILEEGNAQVILRLTLSNSQYPRGNTLTLSEINSKEMEKAQEKTEETEKERGTLERTMSMSSYSLPRVTVRFSIHYHTNNGEDVRVIGSNYKLGDWDPWKASIMEWTSGDIWVLELSFRKVFIPFEYKYVVLNNHHGASRWESISNRRMDVADREFINRFETWDKL